MRCISVFQALPLPTKLLCIKLKINTLPFLVIKYPLKHCTPLMEPVFAYIYGVAWVFLYQPFSVPSVPPDGNKSKRDTKTGKVNSGCYIDCVLTNLSTDNEVDEE